jgi:mediator of RNA polymerase II transcription subunit 17, fungi type
MLSAVLPLLLARAHYMLKARRLASKTQSSLRPGQPGGSSSQSQPPGPAQGATAKPQDLATHSILQLLVDMVQYQVFCDRLDGEVTKLENALDEAGVKRKVQFHRLGQGFGGKGLVDLLTPESATADKDGSFVVTGDLMIRIDRRWGGCLGT